MTNFSSITSSVFTTLVENSGSALAVNASMPAGEPTSFYTTNTTQSFAEQPQFYTNIQWSGDTVGNGQVWTGDIPNVGWSNVPITTTPNLGGVYPPPIPIKIIPDLESLEEGVHDIPGGKIIIKKIKVTEQELDLALEETIGHTPTDEEKKQLHDELTDIANSEERAV